MDLMQQIALLASQADETAEERAERLEQAGAEADVGPETLYDVEEDLRRLAREQRDLNPEKMEQIEAFTQQFAPMLGIPPDKADELAIKLATQLAMDKPETTATIVRSLHQVFSERGLYNELDGVQTPALPEGE
jgi:hypothetical protein